jgi:hypothetical protein
VHFMRKIIAASVIVVLAAITTTWSVSMLSQPSIAKKAEIGIGGGGAQLPTRMTPLW